MKEKKNETENEELIERSKGEEERKGAKELEKEGSVKRKHEIEEGKKKREKK